MENFPYHQQGEREQGQLWEQKILQQVTKFRRLQEEETELS